MGVYVDDLVPHNHRGPACFRNGSCHMFADTLEELHTMARRLKMPRIWFQDHPKLPHYDLTRNRRVKALRQGVEPMSARFMVSLMRKQGQ